MKWAILKKLVSKLFQIQMFVLVLCMSLSCNKETEFDKSIYNIHYRLFVFSDFNNKGLYLLDDRNFYKYVLYFFDFEKEQWSTVTDRNGLPKMTIGEPLNIEDIYSLNPDSIIAISSNAIFLYSLSSKKWTTYEQNSAVTNRRTWRSENNYFLNKLGNVIYWEFSDYSDDSDDIYSLNKLTIGLFTC